MMIVPGQLCALWAPNREERAISTHSSLFYIDEILILRVTDAGECVAY